jgi:hypothetical protein
MKSPRLLLAPALAATVAAMTWGAPAIALTPNLLGTPDDGMVCRAGYTGTLVGNAFKCSKTQTVNVDLSCTGTLTQYIIRASSSNSTTNDVCVGSKVTNLGPTDALGSINNQAPVVSDATVAAKVSEMDKAEAASLGLADNQVDTSAGTPKIVTVNSAVKRDHGEVTLTYYTFAIPTGAIIASPFPLVK